MLASFGITQARLHADSDKLTPIRWYPCAPGAEALGLWTASGHPLWEDSKNDFIGPGVFMHGAKYRRAKYPAPPGHGLTGDPAWFQTGIPADAPVEDPPTEQCGVPLIAPRGGAVLDGSAWGPGPPLPYLVCGCGRPSAAVFLPPLGTACGCGKANVTVTAGQVLTACGCGSPIAAARPVYLISAQVCACGEPDSYCRPHNFHSVCGCGTPDSYCRPYRVGTVCGCGSATSTISPQVSVPCCTDHAGLPDTLEVTFSNGTGNFAPWSGTSWILTYTDTQTPPGWYGTSTVPPVGATYWQLTCVDAGGTYQWETLGGISGEFGEMTAAVVLAAGPCTTFDLAGSAIGNEGSTVDFQIALAVARNQ